MRYRTPTALALVALLTAATAFSQAPLAKKEPEKDKAKEPDKSAGTSTGTLDVKWPTEVAGKNAAGWMKDVNSPDPAVREIAVTNLPLFGPSIQKEASKLLLSRMGAGMERDPGVRIAVFNAAAMIGFDNPKDEIEAIKILGNTAEEGSGLTRQHAVKTLGMIGPKANIIVSRLTGNVLHDLSYETRRAVANTLGQIGINESTGPNPKALNALSGVLASDICAPVRMESLQSLVLLGPPWAETRKPGEKGIPKLDLRTATFTADAMRARLKEIKGVVVEHDKQIEIWCRVVLMRFDPVKEINDANLSAIAKYVTSSELGAKIQALQALAIFGETAASKVDEVAKALDDSDPLVLSTGLTALAAMGVKAQGIIPKLNDFEKKWAKKKKDKEEEIRQDEGLKSRIKGFTKEEQEKTVETYLANSNEAQILLTVQKTIEFINKSKPGKPGGEIVKAVEAAPAPKKP